VASRDGELHSADAAGQAMMLDFLGAKTESLCQAFDEVDKVIVLTCSFSITL
jgi:hypothetical protein